VRSRKRMGAALEHAKRPMMDALPQSIG